MLLVADSTPNPVLCLHQLGITKTRGSSANTRHASTKKLSWAEIRSSSTELQSPTSLTNKPERRKHKKKRRVSFYALFFSTNFLTLPFNSYFYLKEIRILLLSSLATLRRPPGLRQCLRATPSQQMPTARVASGSTRDRVL